VSQGGADILIVDDDPELCELLREYLEDEGVSLEAPHDGRAGLDRARSGEHGLVVLDVMMPELSGLEVLRGLRRTSDVPVLMLTARGRDVDRIVGLELGADDYLAKPFNPRELLARIRAIHRRVSPSTTPTPPPDPERLEARGVTVHPPSRTATVDGEPLHLTTSEFALLHALLERAGEVVTREELSERVLERRFSPLDRSLDVHVSNLRRKLGKRVIRTVRGHGYLFAREEPSA